MLRALSFILYWLQKPNNHKTVENAIHILELIIVVCLPEIVKHNEYPVRISGCLPKCYFQFVFIDLISISYTFSYYIYTLTIIFISNAADSF